jgi:transcriptional antiterminator RfaH
MPLLRKELEVFPDDLFTLDVPWRVVHVRSRQEKLLARYLLERGVAFYLPQIEKETKRDGRRFKSYNPLFRGYVFLRCDDAQKRIVVRCDAVAAIIEVDDQSQLHDELQQLRALQLAGASLIPVRDFVAGDSVRITEGPFRGYHGIVQRVARGDRLIVTISLLRKSVAVELAKDVLR